MYTKSGYLTCASAWELIVRYKTPMVNRWKLIWFPQSAPKHALICWQDTDNTELVNWWKLIVRMEILVLYVPCSFGMIMGFS